MKSFVAIAVSVLGLVVGVQPASAVTVVYNVVLSGAESVPSNASTASGTGTVTVDDVADTVAVFLSWTGLTGGSPSAAHIHCCVATNANGPVVIPFAGFPATTSGTYSNTFSGVSAANIAGIEAGLAYINIHNTVFPGGEIRGDILPVPEPAQASMLLAGMAGLWYWHRRRRA
jgi:hypothetical protein